MKKLLTFFIVLGVGCRESKPEPKLKLTASVNQGTLAEVTDSPTINRIEHFIDSCESSPGKCASKDTGFHILGSGFSSRMPDGSTEDSAYRPYNDSIVYYKYGGHNVPKKGFIALSKNYKGDTEWYNENATFIDGQMVYMYRTFVSNYNGKEDITVDSFYDQKLTYRLLNLKP